MRPGILVGLRRRRVEDANADIGLTTLQCQLTCWFRFDEALDYLPPAIFRSQLPSQSREAVHHTPPVVTARTDPPESRIRDPTEKSSSCPACFRGVIITSHRTAITARDAGSGQGGIVERCHQPVS
jgi:hypothetical protein